MKRVLQGVRHTSPGKDDICYEMIKHLSDVSLNFILLLFNKIWEIGKLPSSWKHGVIIPIAKPEKNYLLASSYRPIALTSNMCKLMERMVIGRLNYVIEKENLLCSYQSGFRKGQNTMDSVICLESEIRKAMVNKEVLVGVFFDVEKAYDMLWREGLLIKLEKMGIKGKMYNWIMDFLLNRTIQVRVGASYSRIFSIDNGTPQGSVCSPVLFNIMINDIFSKVGQGIGKSLYADDGALWKRGRNVTYVESCMQKAIIEVEKWANNWSFRMSVEKTKVICFSKKKKLPSTKLKLYDKVLEQVSEVRFLGIWMDSRLTFASHIKKVVEKCKKGVNVLRCLAGVDWGATRYSLKRIYCAMIRPIIDYGGIVYSSAAPSILKKVNGVQSQALRIACGAFRTSPISALQVEMAEMPLEIRRIKLKMAYWCSVKGHADAHPVKDVVKESWEHEYASFNSFGWNADKVAKDIGIDGIVMNHTVITPSVPPWMYKMPLVDLQLNIIKNEKERCVSMNIAVVNYLNQNYNNSVQIFTDGSKNPQSGYTAAAIYIPHIEQSTVKRLSNDISVFTTELMAIFIAMIWVEESNIKDTVICSDSFSALCSLKSGKSDARQDILYDILQILYRINPLDKNISFLWIPAHVGVEGNEIVDKLAKTGLKKDEVDIEIPLSKAEAKCIVRKAVINIWQDNWNKELKGRHLYNIQDTVGSERRKYGSRRDDTIISRIRIGHTRLNYYLHMLGKSETDGCIHCGVAETVEHVLVQCQAYNEERAQLVEDLKELKVQLAIKDLFQSAQIQPKVYTILFKYLRDTRLINRI